MERGCGTGGKSNENKKDPTQVSRRALYETNLNYLNEKISTSTRFHILCRSSFRRSVRERGEQRLLRWS